VIHWRNATTNSIERAGVEPALSAFVLRWRGIVQHSPKLALLKLGERWSTWRLRLEQCAKKYPVILLGAGAAQVTVISLFTDSLSLKDLGPTFSAALA
jgi:hypothetical protein